MKKQKILLLALSSALLLSSCGGRNDISSNSGDSDASSEIETLSLNKTSFSLGVGQTFQLSASKASASYSSASPEVASVDEKGLVTGISFGSAIITASVGEAKAYAKVTVTDEALYVLSVSFPSSSLALYCDDEFSFRPTVSFGGESIKGAALEYGSSDSSVVSYSNGKLAALKKGSARVYAKATYDGYSDIAYADVEVLEMTTSLSPNFKARNVVVGEEGLALSFTLMKGNDELAFTSPISYKIDNEKLASIEDGVLIGKKKGTIDLTASTTYGEEEISTTIRITVNERVSVAFYDDDTLLKTYDILNGESVALDVENPRKEGYIFRNYVDEGNRVFSKETVFEESATFHATWLAQEGGDGVKVRSIDDSDITTSPLRTGFNELDNGVRINLQGEGVLTYEITLPAFDYSSACRVDFVLRNNYADHGWGAIKVGDNSFAYSSTMKFDAEAYVVSNGTNASFYVEGVLLGVYGEDVASGKKGLTFTYDRTTLETKYQELLITDFTSYAFDYRAEMAKIVSSIPEDPSTLSQDETFEILKAYSGAANYLTPYELASFVEDPKITSLRKACEGEFALFEFPEGEPTFESLGAIGIKTDGLGFSYNTTKEEGRKYLTVNFQSGGVSKATTSYIEFPKINYALYSSVSFRAFHAYSGASVKVGSQDLIDSTLDTEIYDIVIATSKGKTTIACGSVSLELDEEVAKGKKALRFDVTRERALEGSYDSFCFTAFLGKF